MRMIVKYEDYKQFKSDANIQFGNAVDESGKELKGQKPTQNPVPPK